MSAGVQFTIGAPPRSYILRAPYAMFFRLTVVIFFSMPVYAAAQTYAPAGWADGLKLN